MEYVTDDQGQIKVMDEKGNTKFFHKNMIDNVMLMRRMGFTPVPKPIVSEPVINKIINPTQKVEQPQVVAQAESTDNTLPAEPIEAKRRGRPPLNN